MARRLDTLRFSKNQLPEPRAIIGELSMVLAHGLDTVRPKQLPSLERAAKISGVAASDEPLSSAAAAQLINQAIPYVDGECYQSAARCMFGLVAGTRYLTNAERCERAAEARGIELQRFEETDKNLILNEVATGVVALCRLARNANKQGRSQSYTKQLGSNWKIRALRMGKRTLSLLIALTFALLLYSFASFDNIRSSPSSSTNLTIVAVGFVFALMRALLSVGSSGEELRKDRTLPSREDDTELTTAALDAFHSSFSLEEVTQFLEMYIDPGTFVTRITEKMTLDSSVYLTNVTRTLVGANGERIENVLVPILTPEKDTLVDNLELSCGTATVRTLSHRESQGANLTLGRILLQMVFGSGEGFPSYLWSRLRAQILNNETASKADKDLILGLLTSATTPKDQATPKEQAPVGVLTKFVFDMLETYSIIAVIPSSTTIKFSVKYTESKSSIRDRNAKSTIKLWEWLYSYIRATFGLTLRSHTLRLQSATEAQSYHFRAEVPVGMYLYHMDSVLLDIEANYQSLGELAEFPARPIDPTWAVSDSRGLEYVHAYGRDLDTVTYSHQGRLRSRIPYLELEVREKPPGLMFTIALLALYLAILTVGVGHWHNLVFGITDTIKQCIDSHPSGPIDCKDGRQPASLWPTILFGIPAIVSGWMVSRFTAESVSRLSLSTLAVFVWCMVNAISAVTLSALKLTVLMADNQWIFGMHTTQPLWSALMVSTTGCATMTIFLLILRVRRYRRRVSGVL